MKLLSGDHECHKTPIYDQYWQQAITWANVTQICVTIWLHKASELTHWPPRRCWSIFSCDQAALWVVQSVRLSVRLSVCHTFLTMFLSLYHHEIFSSDYHWQEVKVRSPRSRSQRSKPNLAVTPVRIHIWPWNYVQSLMWHRRVALLFFNVICQISNSHCTKKLSILTQIGQFRTVTYGCEVMHKAWSNIEKVPYCFSKSSVEF